MMPDLKMMEPTHRMANGVGPGSSHTEARRRGRRLTATVQYNGVSYQRDIGMCLRAITQRQVAGDIRGGLADVAREAGITRSTLTRFLYGRNVSRRTTAAILRVLKLEFDSVHTVVQ